MLLVLVGVWVHLKYVGCRLVFVFTYSAINKGESRTRGLEDMEQ